MANSQNVGVPAPLEMKIIERANIAACERKAEQLASKLNVVIPPGIHASFWMLPLLESMIAKIKALELFISKQDNPETVESDDAKVL